MTGNQGQALELQLKVPKENYSVGEEIKVSLVLKNRTDAHVTVNKRMAFNPGHMGEGGWEVMFDINFPPGEHLTTVTFIRREELNQGDFTVLPPGGGTGMDYKLTRYFSMKLPGDYEVKAVYRNVVDGSQFGLSAWTGEITSNSVSFKVT